MAILPISVLGQPILRQETVPVDVVTDELRALADDMIETMRAAEGVGLAAPQVGRTERLCVVEVEDQLHVLFNPEVVARQRKIKWEEGCLSIPDVYGWVERSEYVKVSAIGRNGEPVEVEGTGLLAVCLQHEIDHLHGKLFIDHLSFLKRRTALAEWEEEKVKYPDGLRLLTAKSEEQEEGPRPER